MPLTASTAIPPAAISRRACCVGTAVTEPAKPAKLRRVLQRVPGLRRLRPEPSTEGGYVAARPARQITMVLTPETRATLPDGRMDLKATVDETGRVTRVELLSPKVEELVRLSSYAANEWPFAPARLNERAIPSEVILHFNFGQ